MENNEEPELYKGFDLSDFSDEDKAKALIDFLDLDGEVDTLTETSYYRNNNGDDYKVNKRKKKQGTSPKLLGVLEWCECGKVKDKLYKKINKSLEKLRESKDPIVIENFAVCNKGATYASNILYHLLWLPDKSEKTQWHIPETEEPGYVKSYREAWFNQVVKDRRKFTEEDDGEYSVLTDSEADQRFDDYLEEYMWRDAVSAKATDLGFNDWCEMVRDNDGRGGQLASYDGTENEQDVDGTTYYIYRTN
jgi:hypothetical protein